MDLLVCQARFRRFARGNYFRVVELCAHNKPTQPDQDYDALISINLPSPLQEAWMTDCNRKEFVTINKPARSKCQSKCSNTVVSYYSNSQIPATSLRCRCIALQVLSLAVSAPHDHFPRTVVVEHRSLSFVTYWGLIRTIRINHNLKVCYCNTVK